MSNLQLEARQQNYWRPPDDSDSDSDSDEDETLVQRLTANSKKLFDETKKWTVWGWTKTKNITYEFFAHSFFVGLPFGIIVMQQQFDEKKWEHTLQVARQEV